MTSSDENPTVYAIVGNIPVIYHSSDLRNYFSQFIETGGLECFHFRHRPEEKRIRSTTETTVFMGVTDTNSVVHVPSGANSGQTVNSVQDTFKTPFPVSAKKPCRSKSDNSSNVTKTLCCIIKLKADSLRSFIRMYHRKHWLDRNGESMVCLCMISKIKIADESDSDAQKYKTRGEMKKIPEHRETFSRSDLLSISELLPPVIMPNGNVGTPTKHFLHLIQKCKMPPNLIKRLGLSFPKTRGRRIYGSVDFDYGGEVSKAEPTEEETVKSAAGKQLDREGERSEKVEEEEKSSEDEEEQKSDEDDDGCEEWERHESLNDDPTNMERNKERLYEEDMEVTWEKGGSGIVWYTDATFWKAKEGDFDEQTSDDWDVDTSVYYDPMAGDKDAQDYVQLRLHQRRRDGLEDTDRFSCGIGKFEKHTRGVGRKVMETQGWREGEGLGGSEKGIADALEGDGQQPSDKRGFGYHGEKVNRYGQQKRPRTSEGEFFVSTVYDSPAETDPRDELLRRKYHNKMTYRSRDPS